MLQSQNGKVLGDGHHGEHREEALPLLLLAGGVATFSAKPYAPWKELLSRIRKAPGSLSFSTAMAGESASVRDSF